ncbi:MAG: recombinase [Mobilitalea sp.]
MNHIPFGYIIKNGKAIIDEKAATQIRDLFQLYLSGLSLADAAEKAGIKRCHASISRILINKRYLGDDFYPQIINEEMIKQVETEKLRRAQMLGRIREQEIPKSVIPKLRYNALAAQHLYDDPFQQAEYAYSLIESEVIADGE